MNPRRLRGKWWLVLVPVAMATAVLGGYCTWLQTPLPLPETVDEAIWTVQSSRYQRLPEYRKHEYLFHMRGLIQTMSGQAREQALETVRADPEIREALGTMRHNVMMDHVMAYTRSTPAERLQILDKMIDRMKQQGWMRPNGSQSQVHQP